MNAIGLFGAKTKLSEICAEVAAKGVSVLVTRRSKPFVRIEPVHPAKSKAKGVWDRRAALQIAGRVQRGFRAAAALQTNLAQSIG